MQSQLLQAQGVTKVGLLGTQFTMEHDFYKGRLQNRHGIKVVVPDLVQRTLVHEVIFNELVLGNISEQSRAAYLEVIDSLAAQGVILGCTEIALLVQQSHTKVPLFDTTAIHAQAAVELALA